MGDGRRGGVLRLVQPVPEAAHRGTVGVLWARALQHVGVVRAPADDGAARVGAGRAPARAARGARLAVLRAGQTHSPCTPPLPGDPPPLAWPSDEHALQAGGATPPQPGDGDLHCAAPAPGREAYGVSPAQGLAQGDQVGRRGEAGARILRRDLSQATAPPLAPSRFAEQLRRRRFTNGADFEVVCSLVRPASALRTPLAPLPPPLARPPPPPTPE